MKGNSFKSNGSIIVSCFIMSTILSVLLLSTIVLFMNDYLAIQSNANSIKAYYLAEAATNKATYEIMSIADEAIKKYLRDLKEHKKNYMDNMEKEYQPLSFDTYLQKYIISKLDVFNKNVKNPFENYKGEHCYSIEVKYNPSSNDLDILTMAKYNRARKFIKAKIKLPDVMSSGVDSYNIPKIQISSSKLESYFQVIGD